MRGLWRAVWHIIKVLYRAGRRFSENDGTAMAGYLAYTAILSIFPFLIFATALTGLIVGEDRSEAAVAAMFEALPEHVAKTLQPAVSGVLRGDRGGLLTISALASLWVASNGIEALRTAFARAYEVSRNRNFFHNRLLAILMVFVGVAVFAALGVLIVLAPLILEITEELLQRPIPAGVGFARYGIGLGLIWAFLWVLHRILPARPMRAYRLWPGLLVSVAIWMAIATGFSLYLAYAPGYTVTYGTLAGIIITLLFLYLTGIALIFGAEVNAVVNAHLTRDIKAERKARLESKAKAKEAAAR